MKEIKTCQVKSCRDYLRGKGVWILICPKCDRKLRGTRKDMSRRKDLMESKRGDKNVR